ncbi:MAG TPA: hypothetical protein PLF13_10375 [candidate division Zixibacteria bacterium]|nr:hypothetical protein [candidate division Zixibacteria bacterium]
MSSQLVEALIPLIIFGSGVYTVKLVLDYKVKKQLIERDKVNENVKFLYHETPDARILSNVKWGMILIGIGVAALLSWWFPRYISEEGTVGLMFLFAGIGFLIYAFMAGQNKRKNSPPQ